MDPATSTKVHPGVGITLAVIALSLAVITAVALAVIFAPPFFATAALAGSAVYLAAGAGAAALVAGIAAVLILKKPVPVPNYQDCLNQYVAKLSAIDSERIDDFKRIFNEVVDKYTPGSENKLSSPLLMMSRDDRGNDFSTIYTAIGMLKFE